VRLASASPVWILIPICAAQRVADRVMRDPFSLRWRDLA
jgi:hypothetical protein